MEQGKLEVKIAQKKIFQGNATKCNAKSISNIYKIDPRPACLSEWVLVGRGGRGGMFI